jgi:hypothetical protein
LAKVRSLIEVKLLQAKLFPEPPPERRSKSWKAAYQEVEQIRSDQPCRGKNLDAAHLVNHKLNQLLPSIATEDYLYAALECELHKKRDPEHRVLITELFDKADIDCLLRSYRSRPEVYSSPSEATVQDRGRAEQFLMRLYQERDEGWVYERAVTRLKRHYTFFNAVVVGIVLGLIGVVITFTSVSTGGSWGQLLLATLSGALGATLAATFKVRDTVTRLNDLPAVAAVVAAQALIGATLGFVAWLFLRSGAVHVGWDAKTNVRWETLGLVAFAAGFSEPFSLRLIDRLTSIPGQVIELRLPVGGWSSWREPEAQGAPAPPGDWYFQVGEPGVDEGGVVAAQVQRAGDAVRADVQGAGGVQEVPPDLVGGGLLVPVELERE